MKPTTIGNYFLTCSETDYEPEMTTVFLRKGVLLVEYNGGEQNTVDAVHSGLTDVKWCKVNEVNNEE